MKIILFCVFLLLSYFVIYKFCFRNKYEVIYSLPIFFYIAFNISFSEQVYRIVGENLKYYINTATLIITIFLMFIFNNKIKKYLKLCVLFAIVFQLVFKYSFK